MLRVICLVGLTVTMLSGCSNLHQKNDENRELAVCETSAEDWKEELLSGGMLEADLNGDGLSDRVKLEYAEQKGSRFISEFEEDGLDEILFLYDTHGDGHADYIGDVLSVVSLQENSSCFQAEESWIEVKE